MEWRKKWIKRMMRTNGWITSIIEGKDGRKSRRKTTKNTDYKTNHERYRENQLQRIRG